MQFNRECNLNKLVERTRWRHHPFLSSRVHLCSMSLSVHPSPVWPSSLLDHDVPPPRRLARLIEIETSAPFQRTFIARRAIIRFSVSSPPASTPSLSLSLCRFSWRGHTPPSTPPRCSSADTRGKTGDQNWREFMDFQLANRHPSDDVTRSN